MQTKEFGKGMTPIDRAGQPAELAPGFVFLAVNSGGATIYLYHDNSYMVLLAL